MVFECPYGIYVNDDCRNVHPNIESGSVDMIITDLPYEIRTACEWDEMIPFEQLWPEYERIIKPNGCIILFSNQPFTTKVINSNRKLWRYNMIWKKSRKVGFMNANKMPLKSYEELSIFYKKLPTYNPQGLIAVNKSVKRTKDKASVYANMNLKEGVYDKKWSNYPTDVLEFASVGKGKLIHPTQKPVELLEFLIKTYTNEEQLILDSCCGSASTLVAAIKTNRRFIGIERDKIIFERSIERLTGKIPQLSGEMGQPVHSMAA
jgi:site-specific DNA-methyltransferase (adenine-specific)